MQATILRGLSPKTRLIIRRLANRKNLSMNQMMIYMLDEAANLAGKRELEDKDNERIFDRVRELREQIRKKYGKQEEGWKLIREDRDSR